MGLRCATIFIEPPGDGPEFTLVKEWLKRWEGKVRIADYSTGGWEHIWDVEGPEEAIAELPPDLLVASKWAGLN
jgi:hypothetical protein